MKKQTKFERATNPPTEHPRHVSLYLRPATKEALRAVHCYPANARGEMSVSDRINKICERYAALVKEYTPSLTEVEWCALMEIMNPGISSTQFAKLEADYFGIVDFVRLAHLRGGASNWDYDRDKLEIKLGSLAEITLYALVEIADRFWSTNFDDDRSPRQRLKDCGAWIEG